MTIPDLGSDLVSVALRTAIVYVCLVIGFRLAGKREAGQLSTLDLVVLLVIANAVQNAMVGENVSLVGGLLAAAVILGLDRGLHLLTERNRTFGRALEGEPSLLVRNGRMLEATMRREGISGDELGLALRQHGLLSAEQAAYVFLETNGQISVIAKDGGSSEPSTSASPPSRTLGVRAPGGGAGTHSGGLGPGGGVGTPAEPAEDQTPP
jgi:uncharacterized membrane protein YcaP (DUF421 family)